MYSENCPPKFKKIDSLLQYSLFGGFAKFDREENFQEYFEVKENNFKPKVLKVFLGLVIVISLYLLILPFIPAVLFQSQQVMNVKYNVEEVYASSEGDSKERRIVIEDNRLVIPSIGVNVDIVEGATEDSLSKGAWRRPNTSTPDRGGNTVITGHRFHYIPPNNKTFYSLDKLEKDRKVFVYWEGKEYVYRVFDTFIVDDTRLDIEENLEKNILTLYTCHPLWTADRRLVVRAELEMVK